MQLNVNRNRTFWLSLSGGFIALGLIAMAISWATIGSPLRLGIDFTGGTLLQMRFPSAQVVPDPAKVREALEKRDLANSIIQKSGEEEILIRTKPLGQKERLALQDELKKDLGVFSLERVETVGPTLGKELFTNGVLALLLAFLGISVYIGFRFQADYAVFALVAMVHDVLVTMGFFAILGLVFKTEVDSLFVVALLTIIGFSVNDTVVVYDRIRENLKFISRKKAFREIVDESVNQTLARSINTSLTALLTLVALFIFGGQTIHDFALALIVGFVSGTYSSIFNASILLTWWRERKGAKSQTAEA
ncbi:MAG: protein translocase subunit SecF [Gloeobacterales cyanobacterium]